MYPHKAASMPFDVDLETAAHGGTGAPFEVTLTNPGLYVFFCDIHPYMFAAVIVVDHIKNRVFPLDLGKTVDLHKIVAETLPGLPTASDLALRLVHTFFIITNPDNWQQYPVTGTVDWKPAYPGVPVVAYDKGGNLRLQSISTNSCVDTLEKRPTMHIGEPKDAISPSTTGGTRSGTGLGGHPVRNDVMKRPSPAQRQP